MTTAKKTTAPKTPPKTEEKVATTPAKKAAPDKGPVKVVNKKGEKFEVSLVYFELHQHELDLA